MARARNIKPALFKNEVLGVADPLFTLCFEGLWLLADRDGRLEDRPMRIRAEIFPYRDGLNIENILEWLACNGFIIRYQHGENRYIQIINFAKHQNPHKNEAPSEIPEYSATCKSSDSIGTGSDSVRSAPADSLSLDSLFTDSFSPEEKPLSPSSDESEKKISFSAIADLYNRICGDVLPRCVALNAKRKNNIRNLCGLTINGSKPFRDLDFWEGYFNDCLTNKHWTGQNDRGWRADLEFLTRQEVALKALEAA